MMSQGETRITPLLLGIGWVLTICGSASELSLTQATTAITRIATELREQRHLERSEEIRKQEITIAPHTLRWKESTRGSRGPNGWTLCISLHGGGEVPAMVNDEQWQKHATLYQPKDGIYLAPRAPTDTWFLWQEPHIDGLLERLIDTMITVRDVDPDRIYLLGYSAGGNGVYHLAPRMADRFAAAATMAGYPTGAPLPSLRNLPFAIFVGEHDTTFDRVKEAQSWSDALAQHQSHDPEGYRHFVRIYPNLGHWMEGKDAEALPWMTRFTRNPWPKKIVWVQDEVIHPRFYWLEVPQEEATAGMRINAEVCGQEIKLSGDLPSKITLWLSDVLLDLDQPVRVTRHGDLVFEGKIHRTEQAIRQSFHARQDLPACATAMLPLPLSSTSKTPEKFLSPHTSP